MNQTYVVYIKKHIKVIDKVHVYIFLHIASIKSTARKKTRFFISPFLISTSRFLILVEEFRNDYVAACSTALRNASEKNEMRGYVTDPCLSKLTKLVARWIGLNSSDVTRLFTTKHIRNKYSLLKSRSVTKTVIDIANLLTVNFDLKDCSS